MTHLAPHQGLVGVVIGGVVHVEKHSGVYGFGGLTPDLEPLDRPDPLTRAHTLIADTHWTVRYLTAPRWKRPFLRLLRWLR
ncbi:MULTISPECIES: hypothetical protein [Mycobacteroides]|jgi:hypothetical protein|uniref:hypothetical protein n=1 Tax=Mycobacteroides TaxID=670516 RepID=UPI0009C94120|nr:hypothetical protein [Mycobacteroides abscessus]SKN57744.1 Uncharacterised protein [Mycobacteroides abscessus subsp. massiliense]SKR66008.1 Uncharacterised protein [Mycobacteroides abscessus subsp. abscessus]SLH52841.1 Uncharacterised protein [Mycobacteroides abscessus subsp. massiliense]